MGFGTWNVRSMYWAGSLTTETRELARSKLYMVINPLNTELNPICHSLALLRTHHIIHLSRIRV
jgi:hypothetical protein